MPVRRGFRLHRDSHFIRWISAARGESASSAIDIGNRYRQPARPCAGLLVIAGSAKAKIPSERGAEAVQGLGRGSPQERSGLLTVPDQRLFKSDASLNNC